VTALIVHTCEVSIVNLFGLARNNWTQF